MMQIEEDMVQDVDFMVSIVDVISLVKGAEKYGEQLGVWCTLLLTIWFMIPEKIW